MHSQFEGVLRGSSEEHVGHHFGISHIGPSSLGHPTEGVEETSCIDLQLCFPFYAVSRALTIRYGQLLSDVGLTYPQYLVMLALWETSPATVGELGERLRLDSGTLSPLLKRLEQAGLVVRRRDPDDERRVQVEPTPAGWKIRERVTLVPHQVAEAMGLDEDSYQDLKGRLTEILGHLDSPAPRAPRVRDHGS